MEAAQRFQDLLFWQKAHALVLAVYRQSEGFPRREIYGLTSQFRRAAVSVPTNIAEGFKRRHARDKARFLNFAQGSLEEARYLLTLAGDLGFGNFTPLLASADEVSRLLASYTNRVL